ncbi:MAG: hypothetical protein M1838_000514 [Thelocarpon superellum]|nr:MAG: hypothetical protein M1838_000514 [Thelocarpon superellum]
MSSLSLSAQAFCGTAYDYIIAGGGTAGLVLAARLTEDPQVSVAVFEAGEDRSGDAVVLVPGLALGQVQNPDYDWNFITPPQPELNGREMAHPRGKQLGGSSAINYMYWTHPSKADLDDWETLGNPGWNFANLFPYYLKSEDYIPPSKATSDAEDIFFINPADHGTSGPILNSFYKLFPDYANVWLPTFKTLGQLVTGDPKSGINLGGYINLNNIDPVNVTRSYAATRYYHPNANRRNLHLLTGAYVNNVILKHGRNGDYTATGINVTVNNHTYIARAKKEVIVSAGSIKSPQILELSGIGDETILRKYGIKTLINNPNVGENLQDHLYIPTGFVANDDQPSASATNITLATELYYANRTGALATGLDAAALLSYDQLVAPDQRGKGPNGINGTLCLPNACRPGLQQQLELVRKKVLNPNVATAQHLGAGSLTRPQFSNDTLQLLDAPNPGSFFDVTACLEHPFSRGSVHITTSDSTAAPLIDPKYLTHPLDVEILATAALHAQKVAQTAPLSSFLKGNGTVFAEGFYLLTTDNAQEFVRNAGITQYHPAGTCAMLPRAAGGVVDASLTVYGTSNLRVVDASIFPLQVESNLQTTVYAVAERAADIIKGKVH